MHGNILPEAFYIKFKLLPCKHVAQKWQIILFNLPSTFSKRFCATDTTHCNIITDLTSKLNLYPQCSTSVKRDNSAHFCMSSTSYISSTSKVSSMLLELKLRPLEIPKFLHKKQIKGSLCSLSKPHCSNSSHYY